MKLLLKRIARKPLYTIGKLYIDGAYFCDTIEDTDRNLSQNMPLSEIQKIKQKDVTAIPTGTYKVILSKSPRFKKVLPEILSVPGFAGVRIHSGNTQYDSSGCLIVGENKVVGKVVNSRVTLAKLMEVLNNQNNVEITII